MSEGREKLRVAGFAPPTPRPPPGRLELVQLQRGFRCPDCGSTETKLENLFGPTRAARSATARTAASRSSSSRRSDAAETAVGSRPIAAAAMSTSSAMAHAKPTVVFPAAGEPLRALVVRASPDPAARVLRSLPRFRRDAQFQIVLAVSRRRGSDGESWYRLSLPGGPNGARGWVRPDTGRAGQCTAGL